MRNRLLTVLLINSSIIIIAQSGPSTSSEPTVLNETEKKIYPAAPVANNLMKFEEVPVSYYTGMPEISIPLFSIASSNTNVEINTSLKYHPLSAKPADKAGETGLGWNLIAGGTISRTIRGSADELNISIRTNGQPKTVKGIYNPTNKTSKILNNIANIDEEYTFEALRGLNDLEYDLYQYNFMGKTGRFIVKMNSLGKLEPVKLDNSNLKILCNIRIDGTQISGIRPEVFQIIDDKGIKYIFDVVESSTKAPTTTKIGVLGGQHIDAQTSTFSYSSAFHLSNIYDQKNVNLVQLDYETKNLIYNDEPIKIKRTVIGNYIYNYSSNDGSHGGDDANFPALFESTIIYNNVYVSRLKEIKILGKGFIGFKYEAGREDSNYQYADQMYKLKSIYTGYYNDPPTNAQTTITEQFDLEYGYTNTTFHYPAFPGVNINYKKLRLDRVIKKDILGNKIFDYGLEYNSQIEALQSDSWGYYKGSNSRSISTDIIKSVKLPTGGKNVFEFEENSYSYRPYINEDGGGDLVENLPTVLRGGGLRIRNVKYYLNPNDEANNVEPEKTQSYNYHNVNDPNKSSGALALPEPILSYSQPYSYSYNYNGTIVNFSAEFEVSTTNNVLPAEKTQGSDVGYQFITVDEDNKEKSNGRTVYQFRSPIDYPNAELLIFGYPPLPVLPYNNEDYKRGQMVSKKQYSSNNTLISESLLHYEITEQIIKGLYIKDYTIDIVKGEYYKYTSYTQFVSKYGVGSIANLLGIVPLREYHYGYSLLDYRIESSFFDGKSNKTTTSYQYNENDYPINVVQSFEDGSSSTTLTNYATDQDTDAYDLDLISANMIGIPLLVETKKNDISISKTKTNYQNLLPKDIKTYPFPITTSSPVKEISFDVYDEKNNLIQYTSKENLVTTIIWGYNKTLPIAKIVGATSTQVSLAATNMVNASNTDAIADANQASTTEANLINLQKIFRNEFPYYQITTYSYDPLVGVTSITQPNGQVEKYIYNQKSKQLEMIVDGDEKIIKQFKYNYKH